MDVGVGMTTGKALFSIGYDSRKEKEKGQAQKEIS